MQVRSNGKTYALLLALAVALLAPLVVQVPAGETVVRITLRPGEVYAEVQGTRLDLPPEAIPAGAQLIAPARTDDLRIAPPSSSLYWQPSQPGPLGFIGTLGEWVQVLRPPSEWRSVSDEGSGTVIYRLQGGRSVGVIPLGSVALLVRPERANFSWWTVENGLPSEQLDSASYRPDGVASSLDVLSELLVVAWAAAVLGLLAWLVGVVAARVWGRESAPEPEPRIPPQSRLLNLLGRPSAPAVTLFIAGTIAAAAVALLVLEGVPHVQDDIAYVFQARIFASGKSAAPVPPVREFFQSGFIMMYEGRWFAKYPPGHSLMLVPGLWAGVPWLINPLCAGISLALTYSAGRLMFGRHVAAWAGLLGLISVWVLFMSGSYMSHPTTMMWAALFLYGLVQLRLTAERGARYRRVPAPVMWGLVAGFAIGMAFITREWTALGIGLGGAVWGIGDILVSRDRLRRLLYYAMVVVGFVPPALILLYENRALTGEWLRLAQDLVGSYDTPGFGPGHGDAIGHTPAMGMYNGLVYLRTLATVFDGWPAPFALAPIALGLVAWLFGPNRRRQLSWDLLLWLPTAGLILAYFLWWSSTTIYGPRYWYEAMPFLLLMAGRGVDLLGRLASSSVTGMRARRLRWLVPGAVFALFGLFALTQSLPQQVREYTGYNDITAKPLRYVQQAGLKNALVFTALEPSRPNRDYGKVFFANDPLLGGDVIYVRDLGAEANRYLTTKFPDRTPYWLPLDGPPQPGVGP
jgi:hypothetical protein